MNTARAPFLLRMAWRDSRSSRRRLLFFSVSISLGIAALVAIGSLGHSVSLAIDEQARTLVGADLVVESPRPFAPAEEALLHGLGGTQAREIRFSSMAVFPSGTRLVQVRALGGAFPFFGKMETEPATAAHDFRSGGIAVPDQALLFQFRAAAGDPVKIGGVTFRIGGAVKKMPGDAPSAAAFAPRLYIPLQDLARTELLKPGSVARYLAYIEFPAGIDPTVIIARVTPELQRLGLEFETVQKRKQDLGAALANFYRFLNLIGFISLLLGAVGVASAIHAHLQQKIATAAILRCLGAAARQTVLIYLLQAMAMGLAGATAGALLGVGIQAALPLALKSSLPFAIPFAIAWAAVARGVGIGFGICVLFALPPLLGVRRVSPLLTLRASFETEPATWWHDRAVWFVYLLIAASVVAFAIAQTDRWSQGVIFAGGLGVAIAILAGVAQALIVGVRKFFPQRWSFVWRQGLANLYRPHNRTFLLIVALGLGTFLLLNIYLTRDVLLAQFRTFDAGAQPNIFLFDIQPDQTTAVADLVRALDFPVLQQAAIVTMRLSEIKGRKAAELLADPKLKTPRWELEREYRSTYRERLAETEKVAAGQWIGRVDYQPGASVPISVEKEIAKDLGVKIGDELIFDVQGQPVKTRVTSLRDVDWKHFQTNFFVVFPAGVLENAPSFNVLVSHVGTPQDSARLQNAVVEKFPNVAAIDLTSVVQTVNTILDKVALVVRVMSLFTVAAGLVVLVSAVWSGRYQRLKESVLLRTLGASRAQIWKILGAEYLFLGLLASATGIVLALGASWALAVFVFKLAYAPSAWPLGLAFCVVPGLTTITGLLTSRGLGNTPPLEILRREAE